MPLMCRMLLAALCLTGTTAESVAAKDAPTTDYVLELESVRVTATRRPARSLDVAEAVTLVDASRISREAPRVLAELLRGQAGTYFQQTTPGQGVPVIRGLKGSEVLHLVDGMRLNNAFFRNAPSQYVALVDGQAVDRVEVVRGSAPSMHGADAMGGVVQVLTWEPDFSAETWQQEGRIYATFNSADESFTGRASGAAGKDGSAISGGVTWQEFGDRTVGGGATLEPTAFQVRAGDFKWRQSLSPSTELMLSAQVLDQPSTPRFDELTPGYGQDEPSSSVYEFKPNRRSFLHARLRLDSESAWFQRMEVHAARQVMIDDRLTQEFASPVQVSESNQSTLDGVTVQFNTAWGQTGAKQSDLVWGLEYYTDTVDSSRLDRNTGTGTSVEGRGRFPDDSRMDSFALYVANRWQWERLMFEAGLRYSAFEVTLPAGAGLAESRVEPTDLTGDVHASFELQAGLRLMANAGRGFRPPNIFDLGTLGSRPGNRFNVPNSDLQPESVYSYDLGIKSAGSRWETELFVFYSDYRDKITSVFTGDTTPEGRLVVRSENLNQAELYGVESGFKWQASEVLELYGVLNYIHGEEHDLSLGTVPADRVPPLNGRLGLVYTAAHGARLQPWIDFAAKQDRLSPRDQDDPRIRPGGTPGYTTFNLLVSWQFGPRLELGLRLENLSDENYREHGSGVDAAGRNIGFWFNAVY